MEGKERLLSFYVLLNCLQINVVLTSLVLILFLSSCRNNNYSIVKYGAVGDGATINTSAIQKAIDEASEKGGGKVVVPSGQFVSGSIELKSKVELHLEKGARLLGSTNRLDYGEDNANAFINAENQKNVSITGEGIIDGQGAEVVKDLYRLLRSGRLNGKQWDTKRPGEGLRPELIEFQRCENIRISGITLKNSAAWVLTLRNSSEIIIDSLTINSTVYWNNDGIDLVNCRNAWVSNCNIDCADDGICLKSEGEIDGYCDNITIENCTCRTSASGFKLGTGSHGGFKNITVRNLTVYDTYRSAVAIECVDGGFLENVDVRNVIAKHTGNAFLIRLGHRNKDDQYSTLKNIHIENLYAEIPAGKPDIGYPIEGPRQKYQHNVFPASITGLPGHFVEDVTLKNIEIVYEGGGNKETAYFDWKKLDEVTENEAGYPEFSMFGELPVWGLYVRHAKGLTFDNVKISKQGTDYRPAVAFNDVIGLNIQQMEIPDKEVLPEVIFRNVYNLQQNNILLPVDLAKGIYELK